MSSLARSRSLRKPTPSSTTSHNATKDIAEPRLGSPSRLPVKPPTRSVSIASTNDASATRMKRPVGSALGRTASTRPTRTVSAVQEPARKETSRYPPSTTTTRQPITAPRPTSSGSGPTAQTRRVATHTRAKSSATVPTNLNPSTVLRPPSTGANLGSASSRPLRSLSVDKTAKAPASTSTAASTKAQSRLRPTFSTLQQHYSPAKSSAPKALTSTFLAPPSPSKLPANIAASAETGKLQAELLQLHLLHRDAASIDTLWRASAKEKLGQRCAALAKASKDVSERERAGLERENVVALKSWAQGRGLDDKVQGLDAVVNGVWTLSEPGGRYARIVRRFEKWVDQVGELEEGRRVGTTGLNGALFIDELDASWKDDIESTVRKIETWRRQLQEIGNAPNEQGVEKSSLGRMLDGCWGLVHGMSDELRFMEQFEEEALAKEEAWIQRMNRAEDSDDTPKAGAIWRIIY